jgi:hypothetical protein
LKTARRILLACGGLAAAAAAAVTLWVASPTNTNLSLPQPLEAWHGKAPSGPYNQDFAALSSAFRPQQYRSFCGPATIETVLRAYGRAHVDQTDIFPSISSKLDTFYTGMSLTELAELAHSAGLNTDIVYADSLDLETFRARLKANLERPDDFVVVNYDRRVLKQAGAGHISAIAAYDESRDAFLVLDEAAYRYPFTWVPAPLLYQAAHTRAGEHFRGVLFVSGYRPVSCVDASCR